MRSPDVSHATAHSPVLSPKTSDPPTTGPSVPIVPVSPPTVNPSPNLSRPSAPVLVCEPRQTPRPERVNRELARLQGFNDQGSNEGAASGSRQHQVPTQYLANAAVDDTGTTNFGNSDSDFEYHFNNFVSPEWNEESLCFQTTSESERDNPFVNGFLLNPSHEPFVPFDETEQTLHQADVRLGYY
jgi:hypothetical protein